MKIMKYKLGQLVSVFIIVFCAYTLTSCEAGFLDTVPTDSVSSENVWTTSNLATKVVAGVYSNLLDDYRDTPWDGRTFWDTRSVVMEMDRNWIWNVANMTGTATASTGEFAVYWKRLYEGVHRANDVIANIEKVPDMSHADKARYIAECKFLRAWFYMRLNILWRGVPIYLEPVEPDECNRARSSEAEVWSSIVTDLTDCINETNLPDKYESGSSNYGHITKGAAYALRGKAYLWLEEYSKAEQDFKAIGGMGYSLFPNYKTLLKEENERCEEMIFSIQCVDEAGLGHVKNWVFGNRNTVGYAWNNYIPNPNYIETYECADGKSFNWDDFIPGYSSMSPKARSVYFLRDNMTEQEKQTMIDFGADMSKYLPTGNEARIKAVYDDRDPRLGMSIITPYSTYIGGCTGAATSYTLRWPYRGSDAAEPYDLRTDTNSKYYYLWRKFVYEGTEHKNMNYSPVDLPLIRYADVLLNLAEALNEQGKTDEAIVYINKVRERVGHILLNSNEYTKVSGQDDMRERIRNERYWELAGEDYLYFDELRWKTWKEKKFAEGNGLMEIWGATTYTWSWGGEKCWKWAIPAAEIERNSNIIQNEGWN